MGENIFIWGEKMDRLSMSVQYVKGVGPKRAAKLKRLNIFNVEDLIYYFPRSYEDRTKFCKLSECLDGSKTSLEVVVSGCPTVLRPRKGLSIVKIPVKDETGNGYLVWFNQDYMADSFKLGDFLSVHGKVKKIMNEVQILNPVCDKGSTDRKKVARIVPVYQLTDKLTNNEMITLVNNVLKNFLDQIDDSLPKKLIDELNLMPLKKALINIHFPSDKESYIRARRRLVFEELLTLQLGLFMIKDKVKADNTGIVFKKTDEIDKFIQSLSFQLTNAQKRVFKEIEADMESEKQMNRLVQGDVGSGKTIIAILAMIKSWKSGYQSVMMAPTEILATQHYETISALVAKYGIRCELLVGSITSKKKEEIQEKLKSGEIDIFS